MQAGIFAFVAVNVNDDILNEVQGLAVGGLEVFQIGGKDVVGFSGRNTQGEFTVMVGIEFPLGLLVFGAADFYEYAINRAIVGTPDRTGDQGVGLVVGPLSREQVFLKAKARQEQQN